MLKLTLKEISAWMQAKLIPEGTAPKLITGIATDTRLLQPGDLFVAIQGERVDGHDFLLEAEKKGAAAALIQQEKADQQTLKKLTLPCLLVKDPELALGALAKHYRAQFSIPFIALTGSSGKTTVKEMISSILAEQSLALCTQGNLNTGIGVPLTLMRLTPEHQVAVIEMGARKKGDIQYLMQLVKPQITLITNAGTAHMGEFGGSKAIAEAKGEIFSGLPPQGIAVINRDDAYAKYWQDLLTTQKIISFGLDASADIRADKLQLLPEAVNFKLITPQGNIFIDIPLPGLHTIQNALAAAAVAYSLGLPLDSIRLGLASFKSISGRLQIKTTLNGVRVIDDCYNANPASMEAALKVLSAFPGEKIFVMGDMFELGSEERVLHQAIGTLAKNLKIDHLLGVGDLTRAAVESFGENAKHFRNKSSLIQAMQAGIEKKLSENNAETDLKTENQNPHQGFYQTTILIKGSRGMRMEEVVKALIEGNQGRKT